MMEITSIDDDSFKNLPYVSLTINHTNHALANNLSRHPVHGIIFLFKYREVEDGTAALSKCPQNIWFANQVSLFFLFHILPLN